MDMRAFILAMAVLAGAVLADGQTAPAAAAQNGATVLLLPLKAIGDVGSQTWIAEAIEQNLVNELSRGRGLASTIVAKAGEAVSTPDEAMKAVKGTEATHVLFGSYQVNDTGLRVTAVVLDAKTGKAVGSLKATGAVRDLFAMEDELAGQLKRLLAMAGGRVAPQGNGEPQGNPFAIRPNGPITQTPDWVRNPDIINPPRPDYDYWANRNYYGYPTYYWGWPGCYGYPYWSWGGVSYPAYVPVPSGRITRPEWYGLSARPVFPNHQGSQVP